MATWQDYAMRFYEGVLGREFRSINDAQAAYFKYVGQYGIGGGTSLKANDFFFIGDSITAYGIASSGVSLTGTNQSPLLCGQSWPAQASLYSQGQLLYVGQSATPGYTVTQVKNTHLPVAMASGATFCVVLGGRNDIVQAIDVDSVTIPALQYIYEQLQSVGITPVCCTMSAQSSNTTARDVARYKINRFIRRYSEKYNLPFVDFHSVTTDPSTGEWISGYNIDVSHPTPLGCQVMGKALYNSVAEWLVTRTPRISVANTENAAGDNLVVNGVFTEGLSTGWVSTGAPTTGTDASVLGTIAIVSSSQELNQSVVVESGKRYGFGFKVKTSGTDTILGCYCYDGATMLAGIRSWRTGTEEWGYFYKEFTAISNNVSIRILSAGGTISVGQIGIFPIGDI